MTQRRYPIPNGIYFITTNTLGGIPWFLEDELCKIVIEHIWLNANVKQFLVFSFVVMPDHMHLLTQTRDIDVSECLRSLKTNSSREINRYLCNADSKRGTAGLETRGAIGFRWHPRFHDHIIRDARDFFAHIEYIRNNAVRAGLVKRAEEYPYLYVAPNLAQRRSRDLRCTS